MDGWRMGNGVDVVEVDGWMARGTQNAELDAEMWD